MLIWFKRYNKERFGDVRTMSFVLNQNSKRSERQLKPRVVDLGLERKGLAHVWVL